MEEGEGQGDHEGSSRARGAAATPETGERGRPRRRPRPESACSAIDHQLGSGEQPKLPPPNDRARRRPAAAPAAPVGELHRHPLPRRCPAPMSCPRRTGVGGDGEDHLQWSSASRTAQVGSASSIVAAADRRVGALESPGDCLLDQGAPSRRVVQRPRAAADDIVEGEHPRPVSKAGGAGRAASRCRPSGRSGKGRSPPGARTTAAATVNRVAACRSRSASAIHSTGGSTLRRRVLEGEDPAGTRSRPPPGRGAGELDPGQPLGARVEHCAPAARWRRRRPAPGRNRPRPDPTPRSHRLEPLAQPGAEARGRGGRPSARRPGRQAHGRPPRMKRQRRRPRSSIAIQLGAASPSLDQRPGRTRRWSRGQLAQRRRQCSRARPSPAT